MSATSAVSDSDLLREFQRREDECAFRELVERYQAMVLGTAYRRTQNTELARDVAQEVFATLARKARGLLGRASLGGWLHQVTVFEAAHAMQAETRRTARQERFSNEREIDATASETATAGVAERLGIVDEALDLLSAADREAIVLHYFQDQSYPEMAAALGASEPAVRQRVSRALERLGRVLKERGVPGHVAAVLLAAMAVQSSQAIPAGLAQAALAVAGGGSIWATLTGLAASVKLELAAAAVAVAGVAFITQVPLAKPVGSASSSRLAGLPAAVVPPAVATTTAPQQMSASAGTADPSKKLSAAARAGGAPAAVVTVNAPLLPRPHSLLLGGGASRAGAVSIGTNSHTAPVLPMDALSGRTEAVANSGGAASLALITAVEGGNPLAGAGTPPTLVIDDLPIPLTGPLGDIAQTGGLSAVIDELRRVEQVPNEAATLVGGLLGDVLSLTNGQKLGVQDLLVNHFTQLNTSGLGGVLTPTLNGVGKVLQSRTDLVASTAGDVEKLLGATVAPQPLVKDVLSIADTVLPTGLEDATATASSVPAVLGQTVQGVGNTVKTTVNTVSGVVGSVTSVLDGGTAPKAATSSASTAASPSRGLLPISLRLLR